MNFLTFFQYAFVFFLAVDLSILYQLVKKVKKHKIPWHQLLFQVTAFWALLVISFLCLGFYSVLRALTSG